MTTSAYNIFPPLLGHINNWYAHVERVASMGFSWIYINPITYPGFSGSLYAVKDYYKYNSNFFTDDASAESEIRAFNSFCKSKDINVMVDLVINHSSKDNPLTETNTCWYKHENNNLVSPGAWDDGEWVSWGDLASFDNENSQDKEALWQYWDALIKHNMALGFSGFRCDAAYKVPASLWTYLINSAKKENNKVIFFAETLGCSLKDTETIIKAGFHYVASSARWWDFESDWFVEQYEASRVAKQIAFPENHDTERLIKEYKGNIWRVKQTAFFTAIVCDMWMITTGFEFGFSTRCNVVGGTTLDYENIKYDLSSYIKEMLIFVKNDAILSSCGRIESIDILERKRLEAQIAVLDEKKQNVNNTNKGEEDEINRSIDVLKNRLDNPNPIKKFYKYSLDEKSRVLIVVNTSNKTCRFDDIRNYNVTQDISFENSLEQIDDFIECMPYEIKVFM